MPAYKKGVVKLNVSKEFAQRNHTFILTDVQLKFTQNHRNNRTKDKGACKSKFKQFNCTTENVKKTYMQMRIKLKAMSEDVVSPD